MDLNKLKIGQKLWSPKHEIRGEIVRIDKTGWITLMFSGQLKKIHIDNLKKQKPPEKKKKSVDGLIGPFVVLFDDLSKEDQSRVLKASRSCNLPIRTVMEELELT